MSHLVSSVTDALGLTDTSAASTASSEASSAYTNYLQQALDYAESSNAAAQETSDSAYSALSGFLSGDSDITDSAIYKALMSGAEDSTLASSAATGTLRSGNSISDVASTQNTALLNTLSAYENIASGSSSTSSSGASSIESLISELGSATASGITGAYESETASENSTLSSLLNIAGTAASLYSAFSDKRLKTNIVRVGTENGYPKYRWKWNKLGNKLGLFGEGFGTLSCIVKKMCPEAVTIDHGFEKVNYQMIGVTHG